MTGQRILLVGRATASAFMPWKKVVGLVVFAGRGLRQKVPIFLVVGPALGRAGADPWFLHSGHSHMAEASRACGLLLSRSSLLGLNANGVEEFG